MRYQIIETYRGWATSSYDEPRLIKEFHHYWVARLYRWLYYSFSEPIWQGSFSWEIRGL